MALEMSLVTIVYKTNFCQVILLELIIQLVSALEILFSAFPPLKTC